MRTNHCTFYSPATQYADQQLRNLAQSSMARLIGKLVIDEDQQEERLSAEMFRTIGHFPLNTLEIYGSQFRYNVPWGASLHPLLYAPLHATLTALTFHRLRLVPEQCTIIKQLPLRCLSVLQTWSDDDDTHSHQIPQEWTVEQLAALCTPPHALGQLEAFSITPPQLEGGTMQHPLTGGHLDLLQHLPLAATRALTPRQYTYDCLERLHHFTYLEKLTLNGCEDQPDVTFATVVESVRAVVSLQSLALGRVTLQDALMRLLLSSLPNLVTVELEHSVTADGLVCFADACPSFTTLRLTNCKSITYAHLCELHECASLRVLEVTLTYDEDWKPVAILTQTQQQALRCKGDRACEVLPQLQRFSYRATMLHNHNGDNYD